MGVMGFMGTVVVGLIVGTVARRVLPRRSEHEPAIGSGHAGP
jgi:uncharacterized membrane protein YeaQ/YmgE (transglycosylase-associated protein family)